MRMARIFLVALLSAVVFEARHERKRGKGYTRVGGFCASRKGSPVTGGVDVDILLTGGKQMGGLPWQGLSRAVNVAHMREGLTSAWQGRRGVQGGVKDALMWVRRGVKDVFMGVRRRVKSVLVHARRMLQKWRKIQEGLRRSKRWVATRWATRLVTSIATGRWSRRGAGGPQLSERGGEGSVRIGQRTCFGLVFQPGRISGDPDSHGFHA